MDNESNMASSSRWNPTKDQLTLLENLYMEGIRTPSADQIQQITARLRAYGHIQGKNVFYWFQNHKARQRQKQKQERIAYFNRLLHKTSRFFYPPYYSNGPALVSPHYYQHGSVYTKDHHSNSMMIPHGGYKKQLSDITTTRMTMSSSSLRVDGFALSDHCYDDEGIDVNSSGQKTLALFPVQPLDATNEDGVGNSSFAPGTDSQVACFGDGGGREQPFIDFFSGCSTRFDNSKYAL